MYKYKENNDILIDVEIENWIWHVIYKDGTHIYQFDPAVSPDGHKYFHKIGEVDMDEVVMFEMINTKNSQLRYSIERSDEMKKFVHFYRKARLNVGTDDEKHITLYCFGIFFGDYTLYNFILPDNRLVTTTNRDINLLV